MTRTHSGVATVTPGRCIRIGTGGQAAGPGRGPHCRRRRDHDPSGTAPFLGYFKNPEAPPHGSSSWSTRGGTSASWTRTGIPPSPTAKKNTHGREHHPSPPAARTSRRRRIENRLKVAPYVREASHRRRRRSKFINDLVGGIEGDTAATGDAPAGDIHEHYEESGSSPRSRDDRKGSSPRQT
jgi:hypothetical protein